MGAVVQCVSVCDVCWNVKTKLTHRLSIQAQPRVDFVVIINPSSGPGNTTTPSDEYTQQVVQLNGVKSVKTVGYVRTNYTNRPINDVLADVRTYAGWSSANANLSMHGIFLDESPHQYTDSAASYMRTVTSAIKSSTGIQGQKLVIRNPGTIPDPRFNDTNTDVVVFFESDYTSYQNQVSSLQAQPDTRSKYSIMVNSAPSMSTGGLRNYVVGLSRLAEYLFITDNTQDYYESFGSDWNEFTSVVPTN